MLKEQRERNLNMLVQYHNNKDLALKGQKQSFDCLIECWKLHESDRIQLRALEEDEAVI